MKFTRISRIYVDTSVVGGMFDPEFKKMTKPFWDAVQLGKIIIIASNLLGEELQGAPKRVQDFFQDMPLSQIEHIIATDEADALAKQYIVENVVGKSSFDDCKHIALATLTNADVLVSWNFKHIVNINRINGYNSVNLKLGYPQINIRTPYEVINEYD